MKIWAFPCCFISLDRQTRKLLVHEPHRRAAIMSSTTSSAEAVAAADGAEIPQLTSLLVVSLCWIAIFSEGYDVGCAGRDPAGLVDRYLLASDAPATRRAGKLYAARHAGRRAFGRDTERSLRPQADVSVLPGAVCRLHGGDIMGADAKLVRGQPLHPPGWGLAASFRWPRR